MDFRSNLQRAIGASRGVVSKLKLIARDPFLTTCPAILSAAWMAGLVLAFATVLDLYPLAKADVEINRCLDALQSMSPRWASARHCHHALKALLSRLHTQPAPEIPMETAADIDTRPNMNADGPAVTDPDTSRATKRKRVEETFAFVTNIQGPFANPEQPLAEDVSTWPSWTPVLQYDGPDFGFDALHLGFPQSGGQPFGDFDLDNTGLFTDMGWNGFNYDLGGI